MPSVIVLRDLLDERDIRQNDLYFLVKEENFPIEAIQFIQNEIKKFIKENENYTREELIAITEDIVEEYNGTLVNFKLYLVAY